MKTILKMSCMGVMAAAVSLMSTGAQAQWLGNTLNKGNIGVAATGQFTTSLTDQNVGTYGELLPHQATTDSPGVLVTARLHPVSWAGVEVNYQYTKLQERYFAYQGPATAFLPTNVHEATAAYLFHLKFHRVQPYVGIGGGYTDFTLTDGYRNSNNQWRGTGLVDVGWDMQTHSRLGFRLGARDMIYRAPDYQNAGLSSSRWVSTEEPYGGVYIKLGHRS